MSALEKIVAAVAGALVLAIAAIWITWPLFHQPSAAAKLQPKVEKAVTQTQAQQGAAVTKAEDATKSAIAATDKKAETHVANIRAAARIPAAAGAPRPQYLTVGDREFYLGVCSYKQYQGNPNCRGFSGEPESDRPATGARGLRRR